MAYYSKGYQSAANNAGATDSASVKKIQQQLNDAGAKLSVDGIWGAKTQAAYTQYKGSLTPAAPATTTTTAPVTSTPTTTPTTTTTTTTTNKTTASSSSANYEKQLQALIEQMGKQPNYTPTEFKNPYADKMLELTTPKSDAEYRQQAENQYLPQFNAAVEALRQAGEQQQLAYQQQLAQLATAMEDSRESTEATYAKSISDLQNSMLRRGMARSSYAAQTEANTRAELGEALGKMERDYLASVANIGTQQQLQVSQQAQSEARLKADLASQIAAYEQTLRSNDKSAQVQAYKDLSSAYSAWVQQQEQLKASAQQQQNSAVATLLQFLASAEIDREQFEQQMALEREQFDQQMALDREQFAWQQSQANKAYSSGSGSSKSSSSTKTTTPAKATTTTTKNTDWNNFSKAVNAYTPTKSTGSTDSDLYLAAVSYAREMERQRLS